jgi:hypothetical protein
MCSYLVPCRLRLIELYRTLLLPHGYLPSTQSTHLDRFVLLFSVHFGSSFREELINYTLLLLPLPTAAPFIFINLVYFTQLNCISFLLFNGRSYLLLLVTFLSTSHTLNTLTNKYT